LMVGGICFPSHFRIIQASHAKILFSLKKLFEINT